jgi:hypothetical protein
VFTDPVLRVSCTVATPSSGNYERQFPFRGRVRRTRQSGARGARSPIKSSSLATIAEGDRWRQARKLLTSTVDALVLK